MATHESTTVSSETSWTRTHTIDLPATRQPGEQLWIVFGTNGDGGTVTLPDGFTEIHSQNIFSDDNAQLHIWAKEVDGTEPDQVEATTGATGTNKSVTHVIRVSGARTGLVEDTAWALAVASRAGGTISNPPSLTPAWGAEDTLWVAGFVGASSGGDVGTYPTSYTTQTSDSPGTPIVATASRVNNTATEDPSQFEISASNVTRAFTIGIRTAADVIAGAGTATMSATAHDPTADPPTTNAIAEVATMTATAYLGRTPDRPVSSGLVVEWDFDGDGDFSEATEDISDYVLGGSLIRGRDYASQVTGHSTPGQMRLLLNNADGRFNFFNTDSPYNADPFSLKGGRLIRVRTSESAPSDPSELVRDLFGGSGPLAAADTGEVWTTETTAGFSEFAGNALADGPPTPNAATLGTEDPDALTWTPIDNSTAITCVLRPADGETISVSDTSELVFGSSSTTHSITLPAAIDADQQIVIFCATAESTDVGAPTTPSGYTQEFSDGNSGSFKPRITCFKRTADGTEDSASVSLNLGSAAELYAVAVVFDGVDTTTPFDATESAAVEGGANPNPGSVTPVTGKAWVLEVIAGNRPAGTSTPTYSTGYTEVFSQAGDAASLLIARKQMAATDSGTDHIETLDVGASTYYMQAVVPERDSINEVGLVFHWTDIDNYGAVYLADGVLKIRQISAGVETQLGSTVGVENRKDRALGVNVAGTTITAYIDGVEEVEVTTTLTTTDEAGLWARWYTQRAPSLADFRVWDKTRIGADNTGILGTMRVSSLEPVVTRDQRQLVTLEATGVLRQLERPVSAPSSTGPHPTQSAGVKAGHMIGNVLHKVGLLQPPAAIDGGDLTLGSVGLDRQRGMSIVRRMEETEHGFLFETRDGGVAFDRRSARDGTAVQETFTDDPLVPGFAIERPQQLAWEGDVINRVRSEVSASLPTFEASTDFSVTAIGVANRVEVTVPAEGTSAGQAQIGDLMLVAVASSVQSEDQFWESPIGWTRYLDRLDADGIRVFARTLREGDFGDDVIFYEDLDNSGGAWVTATFIVRDWYGATESGLVITDPAGAARLSAEATAGTVDPPVVFTPWAPTPTLFLALRSGIGSAAGATADSANDDNAPPGFDSLGSINVDGTVNTKDVGLQWAKRIRTESVVNPGLFGGQFTGYSAVESIVIAVRGFAGTPPPESGGDPVESNNTQSQLDRGAVLSHPAPGRHFEDIAAAETYNDRILTMFDQDRPIVEVSFTATRDAKVRTMCTELDLSDRVRIDLDSTKGFGFDAEFFIETIRHEWGQGDTLLETTFSCSPATDGGGGADS